MRGLNVKFSELKNGQEFIYNGLHYVKRYDSHGFNDRYGFFYINKNELVNCVDTISMLDKFKNFFRIKK